MLAPAPVRRLVLGRTRNDGEILPRITVPVLVTHGGMDRIILPAMGQYTAASIPGAQLALYGGVGHSPFYEDSERFNRELAAFVRLANGDPT
jgi:pimeloyl-ACP methyl ester carboxylesterase